MDARLPFTPSMTAVVTGASGFVGSVLLGHVPGARTLSFGADDWRARMAASNLAGATVYHLAARVHQGASKGVPRPSCSSAA
jgi:hypothetical protein